MQIQDMQFIIRQYQTGKIKAMQIQDMQFIIRQYQTGNYIIQFHNSHTLTGYLF